MAIETQVQIKIKTASPFEATAKMEAIKALAEQDTDTLQKLAILSKNPKAVAKLKSNFSMIQTFLG